MATDDLSGGGDEDRAPGRESGCKWSTRRRMSGDRWRIRDCERTGRRGRGYVLHGKQTERQVTGSQSPGRREVVKAGEWLGMHDGE